MMNNNEFEAVVCSALRLFAKGRDITNCTQVVYAQTGENIMLHSGERVLVLFCSVKPFFAAESIAQTVNNILHAMDEILQHKEKFISTTKSQTIPLACSSDQATLKKPSLSYKIGDDIFTFSRFNDDYEVSITIGEALE